MLRLANKVAVITGGNSGLGKAAALLFAKQGAKVVIGDITKADNVVDKIRSEGGEAVAVKTDVSNDSDCHKLIKAAVDNYGKLEILVNNAGVSDTGMNPITKYLDKDASILFKINELGSMQCTRAAIPLMKKGSSIINVASVVGVSGGGGAAYVASKGAIIAVTKHTAMLLAEKQIRCNAICPGQILTPMNASTDEIKIDKEMFETMKKHSDITLPASTTEDIANILLFFASDESRAITGQVLVTDYGANL
ncbi:hypothetical protein M9Y10_010241 [Tritrichomonas musculus]|uniref:Uncharacterized protein n=1 Tax=Tritrichomonas musculus TaxID=1915356 RepID=A0ABR2IRZ8_9EUKA